MCVGQRRCSEPYARRVSYDLAVWEGPRPASNEAALGVYRQLYSQLVGGAEALRAPVEPTPAIAAYVHTLLDRWPDITEDAGENSPWSDGPLIGNASGNLFYFGMVLSMADEASEFAARLASQRGLICFDPQLGRLRPFDDADGDAADVSLPTVTCASCGKLINPDEPRSQTDAQHGYLHLRCLPGSC